MNSPLYHDDDPVGSLAIELSDRLASIGIVCDFVRLITNNSEVYEDVPEATITADLFEKIREGDEDFEAFFGIRGVILDKPVEIPVHYEPTTLDEIEANRIAEMKAEIRRQIAEGIYLKDVDIDEYIDITDDFDDLDELGD